MRCPCKRSSVRKTAYQADRTPRLKPGRFFVALAGLLFNTKSRLFKVSGRQPRFLNGSTKGSTMRKSKFEVQENSAGEWYWHMRAANGQILGHGEGYKTRAGALRGVAACQRAAASAVVIVVPSAPKVTK
jgi:uncharacterized protein